MPNGNKHKNNVRKDDFHTKIYHRIHYFHQRQKKKLKLHGVFVVGRYSSLYRHWSGEDEDSQEEDVSETHQEPANSESSTEQTTFPLGGQSQDGDSVVGLCTASSEQETFRYAKGVKPTLTKRKPCESHFGVNCVCHMSNGDGFSEDVRKSAQSNFKKLKTSGKRREPRRSWRILPDVVTEENRKPLFSATPCLRGPEQNDNEANLQRLTSTQWCNKGVGGNPSCSYGVRRGGCTVHLDSPPPYTFRETDRHGASNLDSNPSRWETSSCHNTRYFLIYIVFTLVLIKGISLPMELFRGSYFCMHAARITHVSFWISVSYLVW